MKQNNVLVNILPNLVKASGACNGKPFTANFSETGLNVGMGRWFISGEDFSAGERIAIGRAIARADKAPAVCETTSAKRGRGRPPEGRKQIEAQVLPETHAAIMEKVDKTDPSKSTIGKVLDAQFAKPKRKTK